MVWRVGTGLGPPWNDSAPLRVATTKSIAASGHRIRGDSRAARHELCAAAFVMKGRAVPRRAFLRAAAVAAAPLLLRRLPPDAVAATAAEPLRVLVVVGPDSDASAASVRNGAVFGGDEARHAASMLGRDVVVSVERIDTAWDPAAIERIVIRHGATVLVGGMDAESYGTLGRIATAAGVLFLNVAHARAPTEACHLLTFGIAPSAAMLRDARAQAPDRAGDADVLAWHGSLVRFGASQLNERFTERHGRGMDGAAWASWLAIKIAWESAVRAPRADGPALAEHLLRPVARFDGHKGRPLTFRAGDRQLRQPVYLAVRGVGDEPLLIEVPRAVPGDTRDSRELFDTLGGRPEDTCAFAL